MERVVGVLQVQGSAASAIGGQRSAFGFGGCEGAEATDLNADGQATWSQSRIGMRIDKCWPR
jgi:hypothetical protein